MRGGACRSLMKGGDLKKKEEAMQRFNTDANVPVFLLNKACGAVGAQLDSCAQLQILPTPCCFCACRDSNPCDALRQTHVQASFNQSLTRCAITDSGHRHCRPEPDGRDTCFHLGNELGQHVGVAGDRPRVPPRPDGPRQSHALPLQGCAPATPSLPILRVSVACKHSSSQKCSCPSHAHVLHGS